jgi:hypothetical protein
MIVSAGKQTNITTTKYLILVSHGFRLTARASPANAGFHQCLQKH